MGYLYILLTVALTSYGQVILKWRLSMLDELPGGFAEWIFLVKALFDPYIFSSFLAAFFASSTWMVVLSKFELSCAYPFMSLSFLFVSIVSVIFLQVVFTFQRVAGLVLINTGIIIASR